MNFRIYKNSANCWNRLGGRLGGGLWVYRQTGVEIYTFKNGTFFSPRWGGVFYQNFWNRLGGRLGGVYGSTDRQVWKFIIFRGVPLRVAKTNARKIVVFILKITFFIRDWATFFIRASKTPENKGFFAISVLTKVYSFFECMENARQRLWLFRAGNVFTSDAGWTGDIGRSLAFTLLGSFWIICGSLPHEIQSSFCSRWRANKVIAITASLNVRAPLRGGHGFGACLLRRA